ncbi:MAG: NAD(P)/FAD-dependent oxidoreductase [Granulosicoccaceae bacterium]
MHNIAITGCGPAGLSAAIFLHDEGHSVSLYERFEEPKPVGSGLMLQPTGLQVLGNLGLRAEAEALGQRVDGMLGKIAPDGKVVLDINYQVLSPDLYGVAIHRASLFHVLYEAVKLRSIPVVTGCDIKGIIHKGEKVSLSSTTDSEEFDLIVDATGGQSRLLQQASKKPKHRLLDYGALWGTVSYDAAQFNAALLEQRYKAANVMVGVLPCGTLPGSDTQVATFFWSLRNDAYQKTVLGGIDKWKREVLTHWPAVEPLLAQFDGFDQLAHATYSHHTLPVPYGKNIAFIGDAAHSTSPQLGQGANMALLDSLALSSALATADSIGAALALYAKMRRGHVRFFQAASWSLTPFYQSENKVLPWLRDFMFEPVSKIPFADKIVTSLGAGLLGSPNKKIAKLGLLKNAVTQQYDQTDKI